MEKFSVLKLSERQRIPHLPIFVIGDSLKCMISRNKLGQVTGKSSKFRENFRKRPEKLVENPASLNRKNQAITKEIVIGLKGSKFHNLLSLDSLLSIIL